MRSLEKHIESRPSSAGFTLMELLISMVILVIITGVIYAAFSSVITSSEVAREASDQLHQRQFLARRVSANLTQAYQGWRPGAMHRLYSDQESGVLVTKSMDTYPLYWFRGENETGTYGPADKLTFSSSAPLMGHTSLPGFFKMVTLELLRDVPDETETALSLDEESETMYLRATETPVMGFDRSSGSTGNTNQADIGYITRLNKALGVESPSWNLPMRSLNIRYYDGEEWRDTWDSLKEERLPWMVEFVFEFPSDRPPEDAFSLNDNAKQLNSFRLLVPLASGMGVHNKTPEYGRPQGSVGTVQAQNSAGIGQSQGSR